ncbi:MAG: hypothetical protein KGZ25_00590 [Planctomycetes bacterium]|nr:hypothetical protein [Planctomycetota bacterium]
MHLYRTLFVTTLLAALLTTPRPVQADPPEKSYRGNTISASLAEKLQDNGIKPAQETGEGKLERVKRAGRYGWVTRRNRSGHGAYFYFNVNQAQFARWAGEKALTAEVEYFDGGTGRFSLVYDSFDRRYRLNQNVPPGTWRPALKIELKNAGTWKKAEAPLPFPYFQDRCNGHDLRINPPRKNKKFAVRSLTITRTDNPAGRLPVTATLQVGIAHSNVLETYGSYVRQKSHFLPDKNGNVWMETEEATDLDLKAGHSLGSKKNASAGAYVHYVNAMELQFTLKKAGKYRAWERASFPHKGFWNHTEHMKGKKGKFVADHKGVSQGWVWVKGPTYQLDAGVHTWVFDGYHGGAQLDKLLLTPAEDFTPEGSGGDPVRKEKPTFGEIVSSPIRPLDVEKWGHLEGSFLSRGGKITSQYRTEKKKNWKPLPPKGNLSAIKTAGEGQDHVQLRFLVKPSAGGALPYVQNLQLSFVPGPEDTLQFAAGGLLMEFSSAGLAGLKDARTRRRFTKENVQSPFCRLSVKDPGPHSPVPLPFSRATIGKREQENGSLRILYNFPHNIRVTFRADAEKDGTCSWSVAIQNDGRKEVCAVGFPIINGLRAGQDYTDDTLVWPRDWGQIWRNPVECNVAGSLGPMLRFADLYDDEGGIYLANSDPQIHHTSYSFPNHDATSLRAAWTRYVTIGPGENFEGLEIRLAAHPGDWHKAADFYRKWAFHNLGKPDIPAWTRECHGWGTLDSNSFPWEGLQLYDAFRKSQEMGMGRYIAGNRIQLDGPIEYVGLMHGLCPLWATEEQLAQQCEDIREHGGHLNTYFNWYRFSPARVAYKRLSGLIPRSWTPEEITYPDVEWYKKNTIRGYTGGGHRMTDIHQEVPMCPGSKGWREWQLQWLRRYVYKYKCDGMYYDQIMKAPGTCRWHDHKHENVGDFRRASLQTLRQMNEEMRRHDPHFALSGELCSGVMGQEIQFHMVSAVMNRTEVFRYTFPDYLVLDGKWNGGTKDWLGGEDRYHHIFMTGCRFEQVPNNDFGKQLLALRRKTGQILYRAQYRDTVGITIRDPEGNEIPNPPRTREKGREIAPVGGLQAKLLRYAKASNRALIVNVTNKENKDGTIHVDTTGIGQVKAAWLFTLGGDFTRLEGSSQNGKYVFPATHARLATAILVNNLDPLVNVEMPVPHVAGAQARAEVTLLNLNKKELRGELEWRLPTGWKKPRPVSFGPIKSGNTKTVQTGFDIPPETPQGRPDIFLSVIHDRMEKIPQQKYVPVTIVDPLRVYVRESRGWDLIARVENRSDRKELEGQLQVQAPDGLFRKTTGDFKVAPRGTAEITFPFDPEARTNVHEPVDIAVTGKTENHRHQRLFRVLPTVPNPSFEWDSAGDGRPDYWFGSTGAYGGCSPLWKKIHIDERFSTDGKRCVRIDPNPDDKGIAIYNLVGRFPGPGHYRFCVDVRGGGAGKAMINFMGPVKPRRLKLPTGNKNAVDLEDDETGTEIEDLEIDALTKTWRTVEADWETREQPGARFYVQIFNKTDTPLWVDNIRFKYIP